MGACLQSLKKVQSQRMTGDQAIMAAFEEKRPRGGARRAEGEINAERGGRRGSQRR